MNNPAGGSIPGNYPTMSETLLIALIMCGILSLLGYKMRSYSVAIVAGLGWVTCGALTYDELGSTLPMLLMVMVGLIQVLAIKER